LSHITWGHDDDACTGIDAYDAAAVEDGTSTIDERANGANITHGTATAVGLTEYVAVRTASTALYWIQNGITHGEDLVTVRGGQTGSF
jgi:hypothetical protein